MANIKNTTLVCPFSGILFPIKGGNTQMGIVIIFPIRYFTSYRSKALAEQTSNRVKKQGIKGLLDQNR